MTVPKMNRLHRLSLLCAAVMLVVVATMVEPIRAQEEGSSIPPQTGDNTVKSEAPPGTASDDQQEETPQRPKEVIEDNFDASNRNWGSYYDPKNIFCGEYDCYKILGFDYDSFGKSPPDTKLITKRYRKLSREWHPDKSKHKDAKERFVKIARAYEVLTDVEVRKEYDSMRFNQEAYFAKYGTSVLWSYAPKSDLTMVVLLIFTIANIVSWFSQQHRWQMVANRLIKAAVEDWTTAQGGSPESKDLRERALSILYEKNEKNGDSSNVNNTSTESNANSKKSKKEKQKGSKKVSGREKKKMEEEALFPVVKALVNEMHDFGGGFHKPTWRDLLIVTLAKAPFGITAAVFWNMKYYIRRLQKLELNKEERQVLTKRAVGPVIWDTKSDEEREEMMKRDLWVLSNLAEWEEEQEVKNLSSAEQKQYAKLKKKGKLE